MAGTFSGAPSTVWALVRGRPVTEAARAAGALLGKPTLVRGLVAHALITCWWTAVLLHVLPERRRVAWGVAAGAAIHVLDMELIGRHVAHLRDLERGPQLADHLAFGALVAAASRTAARPQSTLNARPRFSWVERSQRRSRLTL